MSTPRRCHTVFRLLPPAMCFLALFAAGCGASRDTRSSDDTFFEPVKSIALKKPVEAQTGAQAKETRAEVNVAEKKNATLPRNSRAIGRADSLVKTQADQERRLDELTAQLKLLESNRKEKQDTKNPEPSRTPGSVVPAPGRDPQFPSTGYVEAVRLYETRNYVKALSVFEELMRRRISAEERSDGAYYAGMSSFQLGRYDGAVKWLKMVAADLPKKGIESMYTLGLAYKHLGMTDRAKAIFARVVNDSPGSNFAAQAREALKSLRR
jgi:TolA-binding protein